MKVKLFLPLLLVTFSLFADLGTRIDKDSVSSNENTSVVGKFSRLMVQGPIDVILESGKQSRIQLKSPKDLEEKISVEISGGLARVRFQDSFFYSSKNPRIQVIVYYEDDLREIDIKGFGYVRSVGKMKLRDLRFYKKGSGKVSLNVDADLFDLDLKGSSKVTLTGDAAHFRASLQGSCNVDASEFETKDADLLLKGSSKIVVHANSSLRVHASGSAQVLYKGNPAVSIRRSSGSSKVQPL